MDHCRDARFRQCSSYLNDFPSPFHFHAIRASFFNKSPGVFSGDALRAVFHEGHTGQNKSSFHASSHSPDMMQHLLHGQGQRAFVAQSGHTQGIADKDYIDSRLINNSRKRVIISSQHSYSLTFFLFCLKRISVHLFSIHLFLPLSEYEGYQPRSFNPHLPASWARVHRMHSHKALRYALRYWAGRRAQSEEAD